MAWTFKVNPKIGEEFEYEGIKVICIKLPPSEVGCTGCALLGINCMAVNCCAGDRPDGKNVVFDEVD